jgi:hypothetical protein
MPALGPVRFSVSNLSQDVVHGTSQPHQNPQEHHSSRPGCQMLVPGSTRDTVMIMTSTFVNYGTSTLGILTVLICHITVQRVMSGFSPHNVQ